VRFSALIGSLVLVIGQVHPLYPQTRELDVNEVPAGARVKLEYSDGGHRVERAGELISLSADTIQIVDSRRFYWTVALTRLSELKVSTRRRISPGRILLFGLIGGAAGAGIGALAGSSEGELGSWYGAIVLGSTGAGLGLLLGAIPANRWDRVAIPPRRSVTQSGPLHFPLVLVEF
jgi:hypothetical protein